jgi:hypothetical protein
MRAASVVQLMWVSLAFLGVQLPGRAGAQSDGPVQESQIRVSANVEKKIIKKLRVGVTPEMRTNGFDPDKYMVETGLSYKPIDYLSLRTAYRFDLNERKDTVDSGHRYRFDVVGMWPLKRLEPQARIRYTHRFGEGRPIENTLRYLLGLDYRIKKTQLTLGASAETYHQLTPQFFERMRYGANASYRFQKSKKLRQTVKGGYLLDYYLNQRLNVHIALFEYAVLF